MAKKKVIVKGFKGFDRDLKCRDKQYEVGQKVNVQIEAAQTWLVKGKAVD